MTSQHPSQNHPPKKLARRIFLIALLLTLMIGAVWSWNPLGGEKPSEASIKSDSSAQGKRTEGSGGSAGKEYGKPRGGVPVVALAPVKTKDFEVWIDSLGTVTPLANVTLHSRVDGELLKIYYREGQTVKRGDLIAQIDPRAYQVQLDQALASSAKDRALLDNAKMDLKRYEDLVQHDAIPRQQLDTQVSLVNQYDATLKTDQSAIENARLQLSYTRIESPINGQVGLRLVDPGNMVHGADANGIVTIAQMDPISVLFSVPQDFLPALNHKRLSGKPITIEAFDRTGNVSLQKGTLTSIDNQIDSTTGSVKLRGVLSNKSMKLYPNQFVNIRILMEVKSRAWVIPSSALQRGAQGPFVYVVNDEKKVSLRSVEIGPADRNEIVIEKGVSDGEKVVIDGADKLKDGMTVNLVDHQNARKKAEH